MAYLAVKSTSFDPTVDSDATIAAALSTTYTTIHAVIPCVISNTKVKVIVFYQE